MVINQDNNNRFVNTKYHYDNPEKNLDNESDQEETSKAVKSNQLEKETSGLEDNIEEPICTYNRFRNGVKEEHERCQEDKFIDSVSIGGRSNLYDHEQNLMNEMKDVDNFCQKVTDRSEDCISNDKDNEAKESIKFDTKEQIVNKSLNNFEDVSKVKELDDKNAFTHLTINEKEPNNITKQSNSNELSDQTNEYETLIVQQCLKSTSMLNFYTVIQIQTLLEIHTLTNLSSKNFGFFCLQIEHLPFSKINSASFFSSNVDIRTQEYLRCSSDEQRTSFLSHTYKFSNSSSEILMDEKFVINTVIALTANQVMNLLYENLYFFIKLKLFHSAQNPSLESSDKISEVLIRISLNNNFYTSHTTYIPLFDNSSYIVMLSCHSFPIKISIKDKKCIEPLFLGDPFETCINNTMDKTNMLFYLNLANIYVNWFATLCKSFELLESVHYIESTDEISSMDEQAAQEKQLRNYYITKSIKSTDFQQQLSSVRQKINMYINSIKSLNYYDKSAEDFVNSLNLKFIPYWAEYIKMILLMKEKATVIFAKVGEIIEEYYDMTSIITIHSKSLHEPDAKRFIKSAEINQRFYKRFFNRIIQYPIIYCIKFIDALEEIKNQRNFIENKLIEVQQKHQPCLIFEYPNRSSLPNFSPKSRFTFYEDIVSDNSYLNQDIDIYHLKNHHIFNLYQLYWFQSNLSSKKNNKLNIKFAMKYQKNSCKFFASKSADSKNKDYCPLKHEIIYPNFTGYSLRFLIQKMKNIKTPLKLPKKVLEAISNSILTHYHLMNHINQMSIESNLLLKSYAYDMKFGSVYCDINQNIMEKNFNSNNQKPSCTHVVYFLHGLDGMAEDMIYYLRFMQLYCPFIHCFALNVNTNSGYSIEKQADCILKQVKSNLKNTKRDSLKISFIGFSMGAVIIRQVVGSKEFEPYMPNLHAFVSLCGPHLSIMFSSKYQSLALWLASRVMKSECIRQLEFSDGTSNNMPNANDLLDNYRNRYLYKLSTKLNFGLFKHVILFSSLEDQVVPHHSALLSLPRKSIRKVASPNQKLNLKVYEEMLINIQKQLTDNNVNVMKYLVKFSSAEVKMRHRMLIPGMDVHTTFLSQFFAQKFMNNIGRHIFNI